jgi:Lrp/AsnC family leucine-responsive transcriptional regulator
MALSNKELDKLVDERAWRLLAALQADARSPLKELAAAASLSIPATAERLRKLEEAGVIRGYRADIDTASVGYGVQALVGITTLQPHKRKFLEKIEASPEVLECHHVTGADSYVMTVVAASIADLERFLGSINGYGETRTSIVMSTPIPRRGLKKPRG